MTRILLPSGLSVKYPITILQVPPILMSSDLVSVFAKKRDVV